MQAWEMAVAYHQETKHQSNRFARSLGYLDWANQPDPFRRYLNAPLIHLDFDAAAEGPVYDELFLPGAVTSKPVCRESISGLLEYALGLSAWKEYKGSRWALRMNPSSGNLHPTEGYLLIGPIAGWLDAPSVFHYAAKEHALERRTELDLAAWSDLLNGFPAGTFLAGLTSVHWREAWKYGERAYRYCQHDAGHALAALSVSAAMQGWGVVPLDGLSDAEVGHILGVDRDSDYVNAEREHPDMLVAVITSSCPRYPLPRRFLANTIETIGRCRWTGKANRLSEDHVAWELIDAVADACTKPVTEPATDTLSPAADAMQGVVPDRPRASARKIIRQRRSALALDGRTAITSDQFYLMLDRVLPRFDRAPWNALGPPVCVHLALFVHLVNGLPPGLYFLVRSPERMRELKTAMNSSWDWQRVAGCPPSLPLYHLISGDCRRVAGQVSCGQEIAADGAFSCGMIAEFEAPLRNYGAWFYRRLFWETGVIGQVLYLEAEAAGVRGTGIGCFFDDPVHDVFGFKGMAYQSLYHFTLGGAVEDQRLTTLPAYSHELRR